MTALSISEAVRSGRTSVTAVVSAALSKCVSNPCNAVTTLFSDRAMKRAQMMDRLGYTKGPLAGVPFAVKNIFDVRDHVTRCGSQSTEVNAPAAEDAFAIRALEEAGAVLVAATNMDELAYGFSGENAHDGDTTNPRREGLSAGGSSSGSAALVAMGAVPIALGTDTNGSARVPAALSGTVGLKPTYGRLSRRGMQPFVPSLDHVGIFTATVADAELAFEALDRPDPLDPVSARLNKPLVEGPVCARLGGWFSKPLAPDVADALDKACGVLSATRTVQLDVAEAARAASFIITTAEGGQTHLSALRQRPKDFGPLVRHRLMAGAIVPAAWTAQAQRLRRVATQSLARLHRDADILIAPATPCPAFPLGVADWTVDGVELPIRLGIGMFTQALTLTGVPIIVLARRGTQSGLPVGIQLIARPHEETLLFAAAKRLESDGFYIEPEWRVCA